MNQAAEIWSQVADRWSALQGQIGEEQWASQTPCADWDVTALVEHANSWQAKAAGIFGADITPEADWSTTHEAMAVRIADPANLEGEAADFGNMPKHQVLGLVIGDLTVHSWDLARSLDVDADLPEAAVEATLMGLQRFPEEMMRGGNMFGPAIEIADDAPAVDRLIAFTGRQP